MREKLKDLINKLFNERNKEVIPKDWGVRIICPLHKGKGDKQEPGSCEGVTLLTVMGKVFQKSW